MSGDDDAGPGSDSDGTGEISATELRAEVSRPLHPFSRSRHGSSASTPHARPVFFSPERTFPLPYGVSMGRSLGVLSSAPARRRVRPLVSRTASDGVSSSWTPPVAFELDLRVLFRSLWLVWVLDGTRRTLAPSLTTGNDGGPVPGPCFLSTQFGADS